MNFSHSKKAVLLLCLSFCFMSVTNSTAQDKLKKMPRYEQYKKMRPQLFISVKRAPSTVVWSEDGKTFTYVENNQTHTYDVKKKKVVSSEEYKRPARRRFGRGNRPARGRQYASTISPDEK